MNALSQTTDHVPAQITDGFHGGHFGVVLATAVLLLGATYLRNPDSFKLHAVADASGSAPRYYAYAPSADDDAPAVLGASTEQQGPVVINDDGSVTPVDIGQVLGASTQGVSLSLDTVAVKTIPDTSDAIKKYFNEAQSVEGGSVDQTAFASALASGNQEQINEQAAKLEAMEAALQKIAVPESLTRLHKLKIIQYESAVALLNNFTKADQDPDVTTQALQQFMKSQQDLDAENTALAQKFPNEDPMAAMYVTADDGNSQSAPADGGLSEAALPVTSILGNAK